MAKTLSSSSKILHNSFWFGLETALETIVFLATSIAVARYLGPQKLGYFSYINFFVTIVTRTSGNGLASATRKYMSEFIAIDQLGVARAVYHLAYRYQLIGAVFITAFSLIGIVLFGDPAVRVMSSILVLSIIPGVMSWVPAQANNAFEDMSKNTLSALGYIATYVLVIALTLHYRWDLIGIASALLIGRSVEVLLRTIPLHTRLRAIPLSALPEGITRRIRKFCIEAVGLQLLSSLVWDRSEMLFLRAFSSLEQIAFYSVSFSLANNLLVIPRTFGGATGATLMVEAARDATRVYSIVRNTCRYLLLVVFPVHLGAAVITSQVIRFTYGSKYIGAIPVLIIASLLAIPRAFQEIPEVLIRVADRQKVLLYWYIATGVLNIILDALLIPRYGAIGAAWGNGLAQAFGIVAIWKQAQRSYTFSFPVLTAVRLLLAAACMSLVSLYTVRNIPAAYGIVVAIFAAIPSYVLFVRLFSGLEIEDIARLSLIGNKLPLKAQHIYLRVVLFATAASNQSR